MASFMRFPAGVLLLAVSLACPAQSFTFAQKEAGTRAHPEVVAHHGGALDDPALQDYVARVGRRLAAVSAQPDESWTFTILDDPAIRAFALPGGYVYVSRGLMAFATSEAELAAAMAQQMAHLLRNHIAQAPAPALATAGAILAAEGLPATAAPALVPLPDAAQEAAAALDGILLLSKANYPSAAAAALAERLVAQDRAGEQPGTLPVRMLGATPADRQVAASAIVAASASSTVFAADPRREEYLQRLHGLTWGPSADQGFVRGNRIVHPGLGFAVELPEGYAISHGPAQVVATGPGGARLVIDTADPSGPRLESYLRDRWAPSLMRRVKSGYLYDLRPVTLGGQDAATAFQPYEDETGAKVAQLTVIGGPGRLYRVLAIAPAEDIAASLAMEAALDSFRLLSVAEAAAERPLRLHIHEVRPGDSINLFAAAMPVRPGAEERFRRINGLGPREIPLVGSLVKLVVE